MNALRKPGRMLALALHLCRKDVGVCIDVGRPHPSLVRHDTQDRRLMNEDGIAYRPVRAAWVAAIHGVDNRCRKGTAAYRNLEWMLIKPSVVAELGIADGGWSIRNSRTACSVPLVEQFDPLLGSHIMALAANHRIAPGGDDSRHILFSSLRRVRKHFQQTR